MIIYSLPRNDNSNERIFIA